jgi:hypothetical protein
MYFRCAISGENLPYSGNWIYSPYQKKTLPAQKQEAPFMYPDLALLNWIFTDMEWRP